MFIERGSRNVNLNVSLLMPLSGMVLVLAPEVGTAMPYFEVRGPVLFSVSSSKV